MPGLQWCCERCLTSLFYSLPAAFIEFYHRLCRKRKMVGTSIRIWSVAFCIESIMNYFTPSPTVCFSMSPQGQLASAVTPRPTELHEGGPIPVSGFQALKPRYKIMYKAKHFQTKLEIHLFTTTEAPEVLSLQPLKTTLDEYKSFWATFSYKTKRNQKIPMTEKMYQSDVKDHSEFVQA